MKFGICLLSIVPVRSTPSDKGEMCTQLLFGELYSILEFDLNKKWIRIKITEDGYEGWISANQSYSIIDENHASEIPKLNTYYVKNLLGFVNTNDSRKFFIPAGSVFHSYEAHKNLMIVDNTSFSIDLESITDLLDPIDRSKLVKYSFNYLNTPYLWGGKTPFGIDCSGLVQQVFKLHGCKLPRDAWQQANEGTEISIDDVQPGDLAFFKNEEKKITHVGILYAKDKIIHASGCVKVNFLDEKGIYKQREKEKIYSHQLAFIKKIIP